MLKNGTKEAYLVKDPTLVVGNILVGERYVEPQGKGHITCEATGDRADIQFKERGFFANKAEENYVEAFITNK